jgi:GTP cyclohydrolase IA
MSKQLVEKANGNLPRTDKEIDKMIDEASKHYGKFLTALGFDYMADRQTVDTPKRVAKAWLKDLIVGSVSDSPGMTIFPNDEGYKGVVIQTGIRVNSLCAHHNLPFTGWASVAYMLVMNMLLVCLN